MKFTEYLQIGNTPIVGTDPNDKATWELHLFGESSPATENCTLETHDYFTWVMSGGTKVYKPGTGEAGNDSFTVGQHFEDGAIAKNTLPANEPISMAEYMANRETYDAEVNGRWILDVDGYAYWSKLLQPHTATNLLLDNVITAVKPDDNYYYAIDVILEGANKTEAYKLIDRGATGNGEGLLTSLTTQEETTSAAPEEPTEPAPFLLFYSEGNLMMGTSDPADNTTSGMVTKERRFTINLTSPIGANTERHFVVFGDVTPEWQIEDNNVDFDATIRDTIGDRGGMPDYFLPGKPRKVVNIPIGFVGQITLIVGAYFTITINVTADLQASSPIKIGETFEASGIEWRVLGKSGNEAVILAEHSLFEGCFNVGNDAPQWHECPLRTYLNETWYDELDSDLKLMILPTAINTRINDDGDYNTSLTSEKVFLLSEEEVNNTISYNDQVNRIITYGTPDLGMNVMPGSVFFPDIFSKMSISAYTPTNNAFSDWHLRSPGYTPDFEYGSMNNVRVNLLEGVTEPTHSNYPGGVRPAMRVALP
ncbi:MAG: DUF6273 domain-containing protein [Clostridium sp.]|nr:DUF6273 domain-containing protein [Clostridium sp.]